MKMIERLEKAIAQAAYPDVHPDFTDAAWRRMAEAVLNELLAGPTQSMIEAALVRRKRMGLLESQTCPYAEFEAMIAQAMGERND